MLKLDYSNVEFQNFPGGEDPLFRGREGRGRERGRGLIGRGGTGRDRGGKKGGRGGMGVVGRGGALDMGSAPPP